MTRSTKDEARGLFQKSVKLLSELAAIVVAFFATGPLYSVTVSYVIVFTQRQYGNGFEIVVEIFWFFIIGTSTYAIARATVATLIMIGGTAIMIRLF